MPALPSYVKLGWRETSEAPAPVVVRSEMERGVPKQRRISADTMVTVPLRLYFDTKQQSVDFEEWFFGDIEGGAVAFDWTNPRSGLVVQAKVVNGDIGQLKPGNKTWAYAYRDVKFEYLRAGYVVLAPGRYNIVPERIFGTQRSTTATYIDAAGVLQTAAINVPRYEGGQLLVEATGTNLFVNPEAFGVGLGVAITQNESNAPDNAATADLVLETAVTSEHYVGDRNIAVVAGVPHTFFTHIKAYPGSSRTFFMRTATAGVGGAFVDPVSGGVTSVTGVFSNVYTIALANGWWRVVATVTPTTTGTLVVRHQLVNAGTTVYLGVVSEGMRFWGGDVKVGGYSSYIPNATPRAADTITVSA